MDTWWSDLRHAGRGLGRAPVFGSAAVVTLAIGMATVTIALLVFDALYVERMPYRDAPRLAIVWATDAATGRQRDTTNYPDYLDWKTQSRSWAGLSAYRLQSFSLIGGDQPERVAGLRGSPDLLQTLGVVPALGRTFLPDEDRDGRERVALIGHDLWQRRFAGSTALIGQTIALDEVPHTVIGILPAGFHFPPYQPGASASTASPSPGSLSGGRTDVIVPFVPRTARGGGYLRVVGRLAPGVPASAAQAELAGIAQRLEMAYPGPNKGRGVRIVDLREAFAGDYRAAWRLLAAGVGLLWLIACANVASLILARHLSRTRELALRTALGASRARLVRHLLAESLLLAVIGAIAALLVTTWGLAAVSSVLSRQFPVGSLRVDALALAGVTLLCLATVLLAGVGPALALSKPALADWLRASAGSLGERRRHGGLRACLVVGQTALALLLTIGAGLIARSFVQLLRVDAGFDHRGLLTMELPPSAALRDPAPRVAWLDRLQEGVRGLPGVEDVAVSAEVPLVMGSVDTFHVPGHADPSPKSGHPADIDNVSPGYFDILRIPLVAGRDFNAGDRIDAAGVAIVNETFRRRFWPGQPVVGQRLRYYYPGRSPLADRWLTVVGLAGDIKGRGLQNETRPQVYVPVSQSRMPDTFNLLVRTAGDPAALAPSVRRAIWTVDRNQPIAGVQTLAQTRAETIGDTRVQAQVLGTFALLALLLAGVGLYGLIASAVAQRVPEIGVRMALGAERHMIVRAIVRRGLALAVAGMILGALGALAATRVIRGFLFEVAPTDPATYAAVAIVFLGVALLASYVPARRAARLDPVTTLKRI